MKFKKGLIYWGPVAVWLLVIFTLSSIPTLPAPKIIWWDFLLKKTAHVVEYAILYYLLYRALFYTLPKDKRKPILITVYSLLFTLMYSISDEIHQSFVPGRHCKLMDIGFDTLGMILSARFLVYRQKKSPGLTNNNI